MSEATQIASMGITTMIELMQAKDEIKRLQNIIAEAEKQASTEESSAVQEPVRHADWCASVTQLLLSMPPRKAPCNCQQQPKREYMCSQTETLCSKCTDICEAEQEPKREWVGLTDEDEIDWDEVGLRSLVKAVEAKLKEKNT